MSWTTGVDDGRSSTAQRVGEAALQRAKSVKAVILDLDGVLFDGTNEAYFDAYARALSALGMSIPQEEQRSRLLKYWGHPHRYQLALFIEEDELLDAACGMYERYLFSYEFTSRIAEIPGSAVAVDRLVAMDYCLGAVTGMHYEQIPMALRRIGIRPDLLSVSISGYEVADELQKPHPYMLETILARLRVDVGSALYVGDSIGDIRMAQAAGVLSVAVLTGNMTSSDACQERADIVLPSIGDLVDLLASIA